MVARPWDFGSLNCDLQDIPEIRSQPILAEMSGEDRVYDASRALLFESRLNDSIEHPSHAVMVRYINSKDPPTMTIVSLHTARRLVSAECCGCTFRRAVIAILCWAALPHLNAVGQERREFKPVVRLSNPEAKDQDDACFWVHPERPEQSTIIASDKSAGRVFVYDLDGTVLQTITVPKPGNIDIRQRVKLDGHATDLVVVNQRTDGFKLVAFRVDLTTRRLERCDENCATGQNYGGCLYHSRKSGRLFFFCTSETGVIEQHELTGNGKGGVTTAKVRTLAAGKCEGAVADDQQGNLYIAEERRGVWRFEAEPDDPVSGDLVARVDANGLKGDVEGLALVPHASKGGLLLVSDQGRSRFMAYRLTAPHEYVGEFAVEGAADTDGIDVCPFALGPNFPHGAFVCHTDRSPRPLLVANWADIATWLSR
jgi:3-phytase